MRKALIAVIAAAVLFAVGAFAAELTVDSEDIASGSESVLPCSTNVDINFVPGSFVAAEDDWTVSSIVVNFNTAACDPGDASIVVEGDTSTLYSAGPTAIDSGGVTFTPDPSTEVFYVRAVENASIMVDGVTLP